MTRVRTTNAGVEAFNAPPPLDLLPQDIAALVGERRQLTARHAEAANARQALLLHRKADDREAKRLDALASTDAIRKGSDAPSTVHQDDLERRRTEAERNSVALEQALTAVSNDLRDAVFAHRASREHTAYMDKARRKLATTAEAFEAAIRDAARAKGVQDFYSGMPWDDSAYLGVLDIAPAISGSIGPRIGEIPPLDVIPMVRAMARIADDNN